MFDGLIKTRYGNGKLIHYIHYDDKQSFWHDLAEETWKPLTVLPAAQAHAEMQVAQTYARIGREVATNLQTRQRQYLIRARLKAAQRGALLAFLSTESIGDFECMDQSGETSVRDC